MSNKTQRKSIQASREANSMQKKFKSGHFVPTNPLFVEGMDMTIDLEELKRLHRLSYDAHIEPEALHDEPYETMKHNQNKAARKKYNMKNYNKWSFMDHLDKIANDPDRGEEYLQSLKPVKKHVV